MPQQSVHHDHLEAPTVGLTAQQRAFYDTFGALRLPGLFADDIGDIAAAFDEVFASDPEGLIESHERVHFEKKRLILMDMTDRHPVLARLPRDPRITSVVHDIMGPQADYRGCDGNIMWCETDWHCDFFNAPIEKRHLKVFFYLEPLSADSGALRIVPGTSHYTSEFSTELRSIALRPDGIREHFGVEPRDLPSWTIENQPGDVILGDYRNLHAAFSSESGPRRVMTLNYGEGRLEDSNLTADVIAQGSNVRLV